MAELYRSDNLVVRRVPALDLSRWVITFDNHSIGPGFDRPGFGEAFLEAEGISAIHVLSRDNDWYQYPDVLDACAIVRDALAGTTRRLAYGSSMGGYAALRLAQAIGATDVLALSPQYSIDPRLAPWERRWRQDARRIRWRPELRRPIVCNGPAVVTYDSAIDHDQRHAALIAAETQAIPVALPFTGHPVTTFLAEVGLLRQILHQMLVGAFDPQALARAARARRSTSAVYLGTLAERQPSCRPRTALSLARRAEAAAGGVSLGTLSLARVLTAAGEHEEALALHERMTAATERAALYLIPHADALRAASRPAEALTMANEVICQMPMVGNLRHWRADMLWQQKRWMDAINDQRHALQLEPGSWLYLRTMLRYLRLYPFRKWADWRRSASNLNGGRPIK